MPWLPEARKDVASCEKARGSASRKARKDVASCEKARGSASRKRSAHVRMGEPGGPKARHQTVGLGRTQGTETSQYLQEEKETSIPGVVASETGTAQTEAVEAASGL